MRPLKANARLAHPSPPIFWLPRLLLAALLSLPAVSGNAAADLELWYPQPANPKKWEQALPLGNGRLGAMVFGGIQRERLLFIIGNLIGGKLYDNLWDKHPPFQIDGNFGYTAGVAEMLVQSHSGEIVLLPALPAAWSDGRVTGLRVRGGFELDLAWQDGALTTVTVHSLAGQPLRLRYRDHRIEAQPAQGESLKWPQ